MIPALGWGLRPCCTRACSRCAASITSVTLAYSHCLKYQYTVCHGGKSAGRYRACRGDIRVWLGDLSLEPAPCFQHRW